MKNCRRERGSSVEAGPYTSKMLGLVSGSAVLLVTEVESSIFSYQRVGEVEITRGSSLAIGSWAVRSIQTFGPRLGSSIEFPS